MEFKKPEDGIRFRIEKMRKDLGVRYKNTQESSRSQALSNKGTEAQRKLLRF